jgi:hypothetical protein
MNVTLPAGAVGDLASSTSSAISSFAGPAVLIMGLLLAFFVLELVINGFATRSTTSTAGVESTP